LATGRITDRRTLNFALIQVAVWTDLTRLVMVLVFWQCPNTDVLDFLFAEAAEKLDG